MGTILALMLAGNVWTIEPGQAVVTALKGPVVATSLRFSGRINEIEGGGISGELRRTDTGFDVVK